MEHSNMSKESDPSFPFPFTPYDIQLEFMRSVWNTIERGHVGIFESPTGTGKTLSLICSAVYWLLRQGPQVSLLDDINTQSNSTLNTSDPSSNNEKQQAITSSDDAPTWLSDALQQNSQTSEVTVRKKQLQQVLCKDIDRIRNLCDCMRRGSNEAITALKNHAEKLELSERSRKISNKGPQDRSVESRTISDAYEESKNMSAYDIAEQMRREKEAENQEILSDKQERPYARKIVFCSRTHSQLAQFRDELLKTKLVDSAQLVILGGRRQLCINNEVQALKEDALMTEKCLELRDSTNEKVLDESGKRKQPNHCKCPYYHSTRMAALADGILSTPLDIEDVVQYGKMTGSCSYYATRKALSSANIVLAPYNTILSQASRDAVGLQLHDCILVLDEAHNLTEAIYSCQSISISRETIEAFKLQLNLYTNRYKSRLGGRTLSMCTHLIAFANGLLTQFKRKETNDCDTKSQSGVSIPEFICHAHLEHIDLQHLTDQMNVVQLPRKLRGFSRWIRNKLVSSKTSDAFKQDDTSTSIPQTEQHSALERQKSLLSHSTAIYQIHAFLQQIVHHTGKSHIVTQVSPNKDTEDSIKFVLLDASTILDHLVNECQSVLLAGGTMHPMEDVITQLFPSVLPEKIETFTCDHVIPDESMRCYIIDRSPAEIPFKFTFSNRSNRTMLLELGQVLINVSQRTPGGIVVFLPSYEMADQLLSDKNGIWHVSKPNEVSIHSQLSSIKNVFREPRRNTSKLSGSHTTDTLKDTTIHETCSLSNVWQQYRQSCSTDKGAILFCVMGGKMSEGINFSDNLARAVIVIGMPYPNIQDKELQARMQYYDNVQPTKGGGQRFYESKCMNAVNQCIGRAIRHINDYATVLLIDERFRNHRINQKISPWIRRRINTPGSYSGILTALTEFYKQKNKN